MIFLTRRAATISLLTVSRNLGLDLITIEVPLTNHARDLLLLAMPNVELSPVQCHWTLHYSSTTWTPAAEGQRQMKINTNFTPVLAQVELILLPF